MVDSIQPTAVQEPGIAPPLLDPQAARGGPLHQEMLELAYPRLRGRWKKYRAKYLDRYRLTKAAYMLRSWRLPMRAVNFATYLVERKRFTRVHYFPPHVQLDANSRCNLRCPGCATGLADPAQREKGHAAFELMKGVIDQAANRSLQISFYHWGEALLSKDFYPACRYADEKGLWTTVHSNLSFRVKDLAAKVVDCGLRNLVVSCDGASQGVYERYRVGGEVALVFENLRAIGDERRKRGASHPWITAKFLVFDHNWHEMRAFKEKALAAGADEVLFGAAGMGGIYKTHRAGTGKNFDLKTLNWEATQPTPCYDTWDYFGADWDGGVYPCCLVFRDEDLFVKPENISDIMREWNNDKYQAVRRFYLDASGAEVKDLPAPCNTCVLSFAHKKRQRDASRPENRV
jgi:hypothetical protein